MNSSNRATPTKRLRGVWAKLRGHDPNLALEGLGQSVPPHSAPEVRLARSAREVEEISRLDQMIYGDDSINVAGLRSWWECYPLGIYILWKDSRIVGGFGIWPLKEASYQKLAAGEIDETEISKADLYGKRRSKPVTHWYVADIVIREEYRKTSEHLSVVLLEGALSQWLANSNLPPLIELCAFGFTPAGVSFLQDFYFLPHKGSDIPPVRSPKGKPVYTRTTTVAELHKDLERLRKVLRRQRPRGVHPPPPPVMPASQTGHPENSYAPENFASDAAPPPHMPLWLRVSAALVVAVVGLGLHFHPRIQSWQWLAKHDNRMSLKIAAAVFVILISWVIIDTNNERRKFILGSMIVNLFITIIQLVGR